MIKYLWILLLAWTPSLFAAHAVQTDVGTIGQWNFGSGSEFGAAGAESVKMDSIDTLRYALNLGDLNIYASAMPFRFRWTGGGTAGLMGLKIRLWSSSSGSFGNKFSDTIFTVDTARVRACSTNNAWLETTINIQSYPGHVYRLEFIGTNANRVRYITWYIKLRRYGY